MLAQNEGKAKFCFGFERHSLAKEKKKKTKIYWNTKNGWKKKVYVIPVTRFEFEFYRQTKKLYDEIQNSR